MKAWFTSLAAVVLASAGLAADKPLAWPQFRGPNASGIAEDQKPPTAFGPDKNVKWKTKIPSGLSSPIIAGDKVVITAFDDGKLYTIAYNRADGKEAWRKEAPAKKIEEYFKMDGSPAAPTAVTDGERIVSYFGSCGLFCYDLAGKELWKFELPMAVTMGNLGSASSPILSDGIVLLVRDETKDPKLLAIDVENGSLKWEKKRLSRASFSTPIVWDTPKGKQLVTAGHARLIGYDLKSGDEQWSVTGIPAGCCTTPVAAEGVLLFAGGAPTGPDDKEYKMPTFDELLKQLDKDGDGAISRAEVEKTQFKDFFDNFDANKDGKITRDEWEANVKFFSEGKSGAFAVKAGGSGNVTKTHVLWNKTKGLPYLASAIAYRGQYVTVKDGGLVSAFEPKTGKEIYLQERAVAGGRYYASPVAANGHIYFTSYEDGQVTVIKAGEDMPEVVVKNPKLGERVGATPAIADDTIYIRTEKHLYAFSEKK
jgi:outer membrane protein assembly factor BamB